MSYRQLYSQSPYGDLHLEALDVGLSEDLPITTKTEPSPTETARWRWVSHRCSGTPSTSSVLSWASVTAARTGLQQSSPLSVHDVRSGLIKGTDPGLRRSLTIPERRTSTRTNNLLTATIRSTSVAGRPRVPLPFTMHCPARIAPAAETTRYGALRTTPDMALDLSLKAIGVSRHYVVGSRINAPVGHTPPHRALDANGKLSHWTMSVARTCDNAIVSVQ